MKTEFTTKHLGDGDGNNIIAKKKNNFITLYLKLRSETRKRNLGRINTKTKVWHIKRNRDKHLFRKFNAYGLCYRVIELSKIIEKIRIADDQAEWLIPRQWILDNDNKKFLHFKGAGGFELQVFLPLTEIEQFKRPNRF